MKVDNSYRLIFCTCKKKAWKTFKLVWGSKVASITAMITAIFYFHIIIHPSVHIYDFHVFITSGYFSLIILPLHLKVNWCLLLLFLFDLKLHVISLNLIASIISIETEASLLAIAKSIYYFKTVSVIKLMGLREMHAI